MCALPELTAAVGLDLHAQILETFADSLGYTFVVADADAHEADLIPNLLFAGWIEHPRRLERLRRGPARPERQPDVRLRVTTGPAAHDGSDCLLVALDRLFLADDLQKVGAAPTLLGALESVWSRLGAAEIQARAAGPEDRPVLESWGYECSGEVFAKRLTRPWLGASG
ncbi:MAG TPA: hypothetical protein VHX88_17660 [Solirubrobacteraceae bacterium]|nr:hypothetical protein [Solirubrobacteraceae bacterium]